MPGLALRYCLATKSTPYASLLSFLIYRLLSPVVSDASLFKEQPNNIVYMLALALIMNLLNFLVKLLDA